MTHTHQLQLVFHDTFQSSGSVASVRITRLSVTDVTLPRGVCVAARAARPNHYDTPLEKGDWRIQMKKIALLITTLLVMFGLVGFQPAFADGGTTPPSEAHATVDVNSLVYGEIDADASVETVEASGVTVNGKPVVRYVKNPAKHWNPKKAKKVPFAKNYYAGVKSGKPFRLKKGQRFPDTYIGMAADMTEYDMAVKNRVKHTWQLFDFKNGQVRNRGFWTGKKWVGDCVNPKPSGPPTVTIDQVVVVKKRGAMQVKIGGLIDLASMVSGQVAVDCGNSSASARFSAKAETTLRGSVMVKARTRQEAILKGEGALKQKYSLNAEVSLQGDAVQKLEGAAEAKCESNNPEPTYEGPSVDVSPVACVKPGESRDVIVTVSNPNQDADTAKVTYRGQVYTKSVAAHGQVTFTFPNQGQGTYTGTALLEKANKSKSFTVTVEPCAAPPVDHAPSVSIMGSPAHLYTGGNAAIWIEAFDPDGDAVSVNVSASGAGTVAGLVEVNVRWDGTACPSGKKCYRATAWAGDTPGTLTITATVSANGTPGQPATVSFPVKKDEF